MITLKNEKFTDGTLRGRLVVNAFHICSRLLTDNAENCIKIGEQLAELKEVLGHGQFLEFIDLINISSRSVQNYISVVKNIEKAHAHADLGITKLVILTKLPKEVIGWLLSGDRPVGLEFDIKKISVRELDKQIKEYLQKEKPERINKLVSNTELKKIDASVPRQDLNLWDKLPNSDFSRGDLMTISGRMSHIESTLSIAKNSKNSAGLLNQLEQARSDLSSMISDIEKQYQSSADENQLYLKLVEVA